MVVPDVRKRVKVLVVDFAEEEPGRKGVDLGPDNPSIGPIRRARTEFVKRDIQ
jgi:hypothetical protein